jgi:hypothetical protein
MRARPKHSNKPLPTKEPQSRQPSTPLLRPLTLRSRPQEKQLLSKHSRRKRPQKPPKKPKLRFNV